MMEKAKLACELEKAVTWIWLEEDQLKVDVYDFSETAERMFGNDIAHTLTVTDMKKLYWLTKQDEISLLEWMAENFKSYFGIKQSLEENEFDFRVEIESWA
jgi:hypothetical protein